MLQREMILCQDHINFVIAGFQCHAIKIKIENHSLNEVKKLTRYRP